MLFNSYEFVLVFLPIVLMLVLGTSRMGHRTISKCLLLAGSLAFYAWWNPPYLVLLISLLTFNFFIGSWLTRTHGRAEAPRRAVLVLGLVVNIGALVFFKYTNFIVREVAETFGVDITIPSIVLPLGISFIVFQKIAFLVDAYNGQIKQLHVLDYGLFVSFFPQLISGPIVHHREVIPQFEADTSLRYSRRVVPIAISFLVIGAFKKVVIADNFSSHVTIAFQTASHHHLAISGSWLAAVAYTLQIYFDFSGYSDMAIGLGLLFGVRLPFNFNSPLKARSVIDFWTRWHMTLTRFLTAYIYNPIVMRVTRARIRAKRRISADGVMLPGAFIKVLALPTLFTFFIAGAWHGAGFQFVAFGMMHGIYLVVNYGWRNLRKPLPAESVPTAVGIAGSRLLTFVAVVVAIPFFRADSASTGFDFIASMFGAHGIANGTAAYDRLFLAFVVVGLVIVQVLPNTQEVLRAQLDAATNPLARHPGDGKDTDRASFSWPRITWKPSAAWAVAIGIAAWLVVLFMAAPSEFLYFQF